VFCGPWSSVTRKAIAIGLAISAAGCVGPLSEDVESHYANVAGARRAGAFDRGWLPDFIPDDASDISELHDVATSLTWACFANPHGPAELRSRLEKHGATRVSGPVDSGPRTLFRRKAWWPASMADPAVEAYRVVERQGFELMVGIDRGTARACFHRKVHS
jgi:hypothetical protein